MIPLARRSRGGASRGRRAPIFAALVFAAWLGAARARAAGFASAHFGGEHGSVVTTNPTALYYNPAGIGFSEGLQVFLGGDLALRNVNATHSRTASDPPDPPGGAGANTGRAHLFNVFGAPAAGATARIGDLALGLGVFVPFGGQEKFDSNPSFRRSPFYLAADGIQRWHVIEAEQAYVYGALGAAYRFGPLSVGAAGNLVLSSVSLRRALIPFSDPDTTEEARGQLDVSGVDGAFGIGVMLEALPRRLWIAASYQSQPGMGPQILRGTLALSTPYARPPASEVRRVTFTQALPDIVRIGARFRAGDDLELRLLGDLTRWSVMRTQCLAQEGSPCAVLSDGSPASSEDLVLLNLRRNWKDSYHGHAGASVWVRPELEVFAGAGFETAAVPDSTLEPTFIDADDVEGTLGVRFLVAGWMHVSFSYTHLQFFDRDNTGRSRLTGAAQPTRQQDAGGRYDQFVGIFDLNVEKTF